MLEAFYAYNWWAMLGLQILFFVAYLLFCNKVAFWIDILGPILMVTLELWIYHFHSGVEGIIMLVFSLALAVALPFAARASRKTGGVATSGTLSVETQKKADTNLH